jgi:tRNA pseudouridine38-40 synthase
VLNDFVAHISSKNKASATGPLDIELMQRACRLFVGEHDFYRFARRDITIGSTCRTIFSCEILPAQASNFGNKIYCLKVVGNGFLRHMIRYIAGALFALGKSQLSPGDISEALLNRKEEKICPRAKSRGLHLIRVNY